MSGGSGGGLKMGKNEKLAISVRKHSGSFGDTLRLKKKKHLGIPKLKWHFFF